MMDGEQDTEEGERREEATAGGAKVAVDPAREAFVKKWLRTIADDEAFFEPAFKRMRQCIRIARTGADANWDAERKYTVAIVNRHINQAVAQLYAKNPTPVVERRRKLWFQHFDGSAQTAAAALEAASMGDPSAAVMLQEIEQTKAEIALQDRMASTCEILDEYFMGEQTQNYKAALKHLVRRTKTAGVGYVKMGFQRLMGEGPSDPDRDAAIQDVRSKIERMQELIARSEIAPDDPEVEELRMSLADLEAQSEIVVREGPVHSFLQPTQVIPDKNCYHLKTFAGAGHLSIRYDMTPERIKATYGVDVSNSFKRHERESGESSKEARVYEVYDKVNQVVFTVCSGFNDYLRAPQAPRQYYDRFWPVFPLVFNEVEHDPTDKESSIFPPSDVWLARHAQQEYNRSREALREHRSAARPYWVTANGVLGKDGKRRLASHDSHEIVELDVVAGDSFDITRVLQRGPTAPIDPNLYETDSVFSDVLRTVGSQEANIGGVSGATATESSIAEASRSAASESNMDDLDEFLSELAKCRGQMYFRELTKETVVQIVGPGAAWPDTPLTREEVARDLVLTVKAGSSGRPNAAAKLANYERAMPFIVQMPGLNPEPLLRSYLDLLDINPEEAVVQGLPSITALNAMMSGAGGGQPGTGDPSSDPNAQGAAGASNAVVPAGGNEGPQPAYPAV